MSVSIRVDRMSPEKEKKITALFREYSEDFYWMLDNIDRLKKEFPDKYIAVKDFKVRDSDKNFLKLIKRLKSQGKNIEDYVIEFVNTGETKYLF